MALQVADRWLVLRFLAVPADVVPADVPATVAAWRVRARDRPRLLALHACLLFMALLVLLGSFVSSNSSG